MKNYLLIIVAFVVFSTTAQAQLFNSYYYDYKLLNPALAGNQNKHIITTTYAGWPSSTRADMFYATYETSIPSIKSGIGAIGHYEQLGIMDIRHAGVFFSKQISFTENSGLRVGTQTSYLRQAIDYSQFSLEENQDFAILPNSGVIKSIDQDFGVVYYSRIVNVGIGVRDFFKGEDFVTRRSWNFMLLREFNIGSSVKITPSIVYHWNDNSDRIDVNSIFEIKKWILLGGSYSIRDGDDDASFTAGLNVKDWVQLIMHVYSSSNQELGGSSYRRVEVMIRANIPHRKKKE